MHHASLPTYAWTILTAALALPGCAREPQPITSSGTLTAADLGEPSNDALGARMAAELCEREARCGRLRDTSGCADAKRPRVRAELDQWRCSPAASRARAKECLAAIGEESCEAGDLTRRRFICGGNEACPATRR
jgi:hypothetical protein